MNGHKSIDGRCLFQIPGINGKYSPTNQLIDQLIDLSTNRRNILPIALVPDTPSPTTSIPTVVADFHVVKWYNSEVVIDLDKIPSLQWKFTNQFGNKVYPDSGVWMSRIDSWLMMYGKKYLLLYLTKTTWSCSGEAGTRLRIWPRHCGSKVW